ncbi:MAG: cyclopropane-fatty-acyl-phospholipid synthase family protein [Candidatus Limnocylindrales bacterium]
MNVRASVGPIAGVSSRTLANAAERILLEAASRIRIGQLTVVLPDGQRRTFGDPASQRIAEIRVHDAAAAVRLLLHGETGAGESYMDGQWSSPDLEALIELAALNRSSLAMNRGWWRLPLEIPRRLAHRARRNSKGQARENIQAHYDLGNDLYRLFLDETMTYSCAVFEHPGQSLADAQRAKYRRIAEGAGLREGMHVLEIGSGWGGFALHAAGELGCRVTSITISQEQHDLALQRVHEAGLDHLVDIRMQDYRDIEGTYDAVVSIEMLEAVGAEYFETYFETVDRVLRPGGRFSLQVITFPDVAYEPQRRGANWIQTYIFPGGLCPSLAVIERSIHNTRLLVRHATDIGPDYAPTLRAWRTRFMGNLDAVRAIGFDDRFIRMWEYYLALSEAGFATGLTQDHQLVLEKARGVNA